MKRTLAQAFQQMEGSLMQVRRIMERHGALNVHTALGSDQTEVVNLYRSLKIAIEQNKPGTEIPDMPI